jgi:hypothetical protein
MTLKNNIKNLLPLIDVSLMAPLSVAAQIFKFYARLGGTRLPKCREHLKATGIYPIRDHYYQPLFKDSRLKQSLREPRHLPGIDWRTEDQINFLSRLNYSNELELLRFNEPSQDFLKFSFNNGSFESGDAEILYQILRHYKPKRMIEIGSGHSTKIAHEALKKNFVETGIKATHTCIEPYEMDWLEQLGVNVERKLVEDCDISFFDNLEKDDILFIDSSHMIRPQGDVLVEYLQIIPRLRSGVIVHIHDIFSPHDYPDEWVRNDVSFWNEQYILEALISNKSRYEIIAALNYLHHHYYGSLKRVCPYLEKDREPGSFYFRIK